MGDSGEKPLLRLLACGSVDDGKSTLLGQLVMGTGQAPLDELDRVGASPALLFDGLQAERDQGITIDVAYRYFESERCKFIVADAPGHEQYTRNLVTAASTAQVALVLVDARKGVQPQTLRHAWVSRLLGVRTIILAINKMDLVQYDAERYRAIVDDFHRRFGQCAALPVVALTGENVVHPSDAFSFYDGPPLLGLLESLAQASEGSPQASPLRMSVQGVVRTADDRRFATGQIAAGRVSVGERVTVMPSALEARVAEIVLGRDPLAEALQGQSVAIRFAEQVDCSRGDVICGSSDLPEKADQFETTLIWMGREAMLSGRQYRIRLGTQEALATLRSPDHRIDMSSLSPSPATTLETNDIGKVTLWTDRPIVHEPYRKSVELGGFVLIDRLTNDTVAAGLIERALPRRHNLHPEEPTITPAARAARLGQKPVLIWLTGLSGAGKSTIGNLVEKQLHALGLHTYLLDGDNLRLGLNRDLGFSDADRAENIRRAGEIAKLMLDAGLIVIGAFISPFRSEREALRATLPDDAFVEVHVHVELEEAERRDPKGLYRKARSGELSNMTGLGSHYEPPIDPEVFVDTGRLSAQEAADLIVKTLKKRRAVE